jgi:hypothetical protein
VTSVSPVASEIMCKWKVRWITMAVPWDNGDGSQEQLRPHAALSPPLPNRAYEFFTDSHMSRK